MRNDDDGDLWQDFLDDDAKAAEEKKPITDGSEFTGKYDRRSKPRDGDPSLHSKQDS